ncbi:uncharacterized protein LOC126857187 [Cataglyphis hispanica]|uniref:uncharacterized protein LOC126857187 n=1 Tax=Cataglyphis hispanica TaxID=1086592 RepID=UPI00217F740C|nr:uncharacterized protein LOC126857187 [Cataglyphis hispanica]
MPIDLYQLDGSAPCRAVRLAAAAIGVNLNLKITDLMTGDHMTPEFLKMNPQHTIPTLDDNGLYLWESRAIMTYLANQYGKDDSLYPKDPKKRALVDQRLYFDLGTLYSSFADAYYAWLFTGTAPDEAKQNKVNNALSFLDKFLEGENYVAGKTLTLADLTLVVTVANFKIVDHDLSKYGNILKWFARIQAEAPKYNEIEGEGIKAFKKFVDNIKNKKYALEAIVDRQACTTDYLCTFLSNEGILNKVRPNMPVQLYYLPPSPPCRSVMLTVEAIGLEVELIMLNVLAGEHLTPEYEQLNPQKTIPFLVDDDVKVSESRAIMCYLVDQYGENDTLYPRNPEARALVDQRLYFDLGTLYASVFDYYMPVLKKQTDTYDPAQYEKMTEAFRILDKFLEGHDYVTGDNLTIADLSLVSSVTTAEAFGFHLDDYENVSNWLEKVETFAPGYEKANGEPLEIFKKFIEDLRGEKEDEEKKKKKKKKKKKEKEKKRRRRRRRKRRRRRRRKEEGEGEEKEEGEEEEKKDVEEEKEEAEEENE